MSTQYTHRNGDLEAPTVVGQYWFRGTFFGGTNNFDVAGQVGVIAADNFGLMAFCPLEYYEDIESFSGEWWWPIVPPWQEEQAV